MRRDHFRVVYKDAKVTVTTFTTNHAIESYGTLKPQPYNDPILAAPNTGPSQVLRRQASRQRLGVGGKGVGGVCQAPTGAN